ncbi:MAG TPA: SPOR domain-containing protein [Thermodesulfovibrionales bacterium]|nr:SPOR domain-containing protein [Thermodesulfovibrionales bacterium]
MFETILIVDNDAENTRRMIETLEARDYLVFTAPNRDAALTMARKVHPRLIFVNPAMPEGGGLELCSTIHGAEDFKEIPIIVLSTFEGAADPRYTSLYGIVDSLKTPFAPEELISKTDDVFSRQPVEVHSLGSEVEEPIEGEGIEVIDSPSKDAGRTDISPEGSEHEGEVITEHAEKMHEEEAAYDETVGQGKMADERLSAYAMKRSMRRKGTKNALLIPVIGVAAVMLLILAVILFYERDASVDKKVQPPAAVKPLQSAQEQAISAGPPQEPQKPEQSAGQIAKAPIPKADVPSPTPGSGPKAGAPKTEATAAVPKAEERGAVTKQEAKITVPKLEPKSTAAKSATKPLAKGMYSVQMGAFKSEKNADALAAKYKEKGYEAFVFRTGTKDTELLYRVLIGKVSEKKEALQMVKSIASKEGVPAILFRD